MAKAKGDLQAQNSTGTINRRYEKAMGLDN